MNIHQKFKDKNVIVVGIEIYNGSPSTVQGGYVTPTGVTFPIVLNGSSIGSEFGMGTSDFVIVDQDGIVQYISRSYKESELEDELSNLTYVAANDGDFPRNFQLEQNYPNPFNPTTTISYGLFLNQKSFVQLDVFNVLGKKVRTLVSENQSAGTRNVVWNGLNDYGQAEPGGVYFYTITVDNQFKETKRMILLK